MRTGDYVSYRESAPERCTHLSRRGSICLISVMALALLSASCSCAEDCASFMCARNTEVHFANPISTAGGYEIIVTPEPDGRRVTCHVEVGTGEDEAVVTEEGCDGPTAGFLRPQNPDASIAPSLPLIGVIIPGQADAAVVSILRDDEEVYNGRAELDHVRSVAPWACDPEDCEVPVLKPR